MHSFDQCGKAEEEMAIVLALTVNGTKLPGAEYGMRFASGKASEVQAALLAGLQKRIQKDLRIAQANIKVDVTYDKEFDRATVTVDDERLKETWDWSLLFMMVLTSGDLRQLVPSA